jgi:hypothetical protein
VKTFLHGGDFGDLIYALPAIRALGGGALYLSEAHPGREPLTAARRDVLLPLLERIDYLAAVHVHQGEPVDVDFTGFRKHLRPGKSIWPRPNSPAAGCRSISRTKPGSIGRSFAPGERPSRW